MLKRWISRIQEIRPKSKPPGYYDYLQVENDNPNKPIDDPYIFPRGQNMFESSHIGFILYMFLGVGIYYVTRIVHDRDWDRYYHVNYPGFMEHFDRIRAYYIKKTRSSIEELPSSLEEVYNEMIGVLQKHKLKNLNIVKVDGLVIERKLGEIISESIGIEEDKSHEKAKDLALKDFD